MKYSALLGGGGSHLATQLGSFTRSSILLLLGIAACFVGVGALLHRRQTKVSVDRPGLWAVTGGMGAGKTYFLSWIASRAIAKGRPVFANYHVRGAEYITTWAEAVAVPDGAVVLLAELQLWWPSDVPYGPPDVEAWVHQLRHHGITCAWDSQHWTFVNTRFRKLTFGVWEGRAMAGGHMYTLYEAFGYAPHMRSTKTRIARQQVRRERSVMDSYDTLEDVVPCLDWAEGRRRNVGQSVADVPRRHGRHAAGRPGVVVAIAEGGDFGESENVLG